MPERKTFPKPPVGTPNYERWEQIGGFEVAFYQRAGSALEEKLGNIIHAMNHPELVYRAGQRKRQEMMDVLAETVESAYSHDHFMNTLVNLSKASATPNPISMVDLDEDSNLRIKMSRITTPVPAREVILAKFPGYEDQLARAMAAGKNAGINLFLSLIADEVNPGEYRTLARFDRAVMELIADPFETDENGVARGYLPTQFNGVRLVHVFEPGAEKARLFLEVKDLNQ